MHYTDNNVKQNYFILALIVTGMIYIFQGLLKFDIKIV